MTNKMLKHLNFLTYKREVVTIINHVLRGWRYSSTHSWPRHLIEVSGQIHTPAALLPGPIA